jgi:3-deoxy-7-phosphoheptulonate synthase
MVGQFATPSSSNFEDVNGVELPSYQGDNIHGDGSTLESSQPYLERMVWAYNQAIATFNFLCAFATNIYH